jgi:hypothetical protein
MTPTELGDIITPAWDALTDDQKMAWNYWSMAHPTTVETGDTLGLYGRQGHYALNAALAVIDATALLDDPPPSTTPPTTVRLTPQVWNKKSQLANSATLRRGVAWIEINGAIPNDTALIVKQAHGKRNAKTRRRPRNRHVTIAKAGETGQINLEVPRGYYASTNGANQFASVRGRTAARRLDLPLVRLFWVNTQTGAIIHTTLMNPSQPRTKRGRT